MNNHNNNNDDDDDNEEILFWLNYIDIRTSNLPLGVDVKSTKYKNDYMNHKLEVEKFYKKQLAMQQQKKQQQQQQKSRFNNNYRDTDLHQECMVNLFCRDEKGRACMLQVHSAQFSLFVRIPDDFGEYQISILCEQLAAKLYISPHDIEYEESERHPFIYYKHDSNAVSQQHQYGDTNTNNDDDEKKKAGTLKHAILKFASPALSQQAKYLLKYIALVDDLETSDYTFDVKNGFVADEDRVSDVTNLLDSINVQPSSWFAIPASKILPVSTKYSHCRFEKSVSAKDICARPLINTIPPKPIMAFDIEQYSSRIVNSKRMFPNPLLDADVVFSISTSTWWYGTNMRQRDVFLLLHPSSLSKVTAKSIEEAVHEFETNINKGDDKSDDKDEEGKDEEKKDEEKKDEEKKDEEKKKDDGGGGATKTKKKSENTKKLPRPPIRVHVFQDELHMFVAWRNHVVFEIDPEIVVGFNVDKFDYSRINDRVKRLEEIKRMHRASLFWNLSRYLSDMSELKKYNLSSLAMGQLEYSRIPMIGRTQLDLFYYFKRNYKLRRYRLNDIAEKYLGHKKLDLEADDMCRYWSEYDKYGMEGLAKVLVYNVIDSDLCLDLIKNLAIMSNLCEMSRVCITPIHDLLDRGQQLKVFNQIVWHARRMNYVVNERDLVKESESAVKGATVIDPITKHYDVPIAILDFASLYPSIMKAKNLCYSTLVKEGDMDPPPPAKIDYIENHQNQTHRFVQHVQGVIPRLLTYLLTARKQAKKDMAKAKEANDDMAYQVQDGRQLALKISANSVYGFTNADKLKCSAITESVTATGRSMLFRLKKEVEEKFNALVVYGDTDSIMVMFRDLPHNKDAAIKRAFELGNEAADFGTKLFDGKIVLEMEKVYCPMLIKKKKKYCGMKYTTPSEPPVLQYSGIEPVQRSSFIYMAECYEKIIDTVFVESNIPKAIGVLKEFLQFMVDDKVPLFKYIKSLEYKKDLKSEEHEQCHVIKKIANRGFGPTYVTGDRVEFVYIEGRYDKIYLKAEDPEYVAEHPKECRIDRIHYIRRCFQNPICSFLELIIKNPQKYFDDAVHQIEQRNNKVDITTFFDRAKQLKMQPQNHLSLCANPATTRFIDLNTNINTNTTTTIVAPNITNKYVLASDRIINFDNFQQLKPVSHYVLNIQGEMQKMEVSRTDTSKKAKISSNKKRMINTSSSSNPSSSFPSASNLGSRNQTLETTYKLFKANNSSSNKNTVVTSFFSSTTQNNQKNNKKRRMNEK